MLDDSVHLITTANFLPGRFSGNRNERAKVHNLRGGEVEKDAEGIKTRRDLGANMALLLKNLKL